MKIPIYQIDAFTNRLFAGNPAAVCVLEKWISETLMQSIAAENNLAETAFVVSKEDFFEIRWFTPEAEVDLCGHATLASAYVLFTHLSVKSDQIRFVTKNSGELFVRKNGEELQLDFPQDFLEEILPIPLLEEAFGAKPIATYKGKTDFLLVFESQQQIQNIEPNFALIAQAGMRGVIITAKGDEVDFVSRFFAPQIGVPEDPVTGSAHTSLTPYWSTILGKQKLTAKQLSKRGGNLVCEMLNDRILISGTAKSFLVGEIDV